VSNAIMPALIRGWLGDTIRDHGRKAGQCCRKTKVTCGGGLHAAVEVLGVLCGTHGQALPGGLLWAHRQGGQRDGR